MILRLAALVLLAWMIGFAWFVVSVPGPPPAEVRTDAIVVLTGGAGRVERGLQLLAEKRGARLLVSGADRRVRPSELAAAYKVPVALVDCCVDLGHEAVDTRSNADEAARWAAEHGYRSLRLVTTDWHVARARFELSRALDPAIVLVADPVRSEPGLYGLFREYHKYLLRRFAAPIGI